VADERAADQHVGDESCAAVSSGGMPHRLARAVGDFGEDQACRELESRGWELLDRNWRCAAGEIDIVARDGDTVVFCEVKTRRSARFGSPVEAVTPAKAARLRRLAGLWLRARARDRTGDSGPGGPAGARRALRTADIRVDVIGIVVPRQGPCEIEHLRGVC
jgi:putative endonuclease